MKDNIKPIDLIFLLFVIFSISLMIFTFIYCLQDPRPDYTFRTTTKTIMVQGCEYLVNEYCNDVRCYIDNDIQDMKLKPNGNCGNVKAK